jgi:hypothetical protein
MIFQPYCAQPEWIARACKALIELRICLRPVDAARIVIYQLWPDHAFRRPEEAAELWVLRQMDE